MPVIMMILLILTGIFLIVLILIQRGKGGGLAGAFGGMGGQSAFGTKAGDMFTRITIGVAAFWIILCILSVLLMGTTKEVLDLGPANPPGQQSSIPASQDKQSAPLEKQPAPSGEKSAPEIPSTPSK
ncbi:MAG: preprotein translocase subunit SecG [Thermoguttaceae bacterium]|jgi:preprotein translocase subunit SecG